MNKKHINAAKLTNSMQAVTASHPEIGDRL